MNDEGEHKRGRLGGSYYRTGLKGTFQIAYQDANGKEIRASAKTTDEATAARILEARRREVIKCQQLGEVYESPKLRKQSIGKCLDAWERQCKIQNRWNDCYQTDSKQVRERWGSMTADSLTKERIQEWQLQEKTGLSEKKSLSRNSKLNRQLTIVSKAMKDCHITPSYAKDMKALRLPEPPQRTGFFTAQQFRILHSTLPPDIADAAMCLWLTGWRRSEIIGKVILKKYRPGVLWSEKDGNSLLLPGQRNKGRTAKRIPLTGALKELIEKRERLKVPGCDLIFHKNGRPIGEFDAKWKKACRAAGRPNGIVHDLRRSRARNWIRAGVPEKLAMELGGWKTRSIFDAYNVTDESDLVQAQERTERYLLEQEEKQGGTKISRAIN